MGNISIKTINIREYLNLIKDRAIPSYKNQYNWNTDSMERLIKDISENIEKDEYTLGEIIYNKESLVDGLGRIISISLIMKALGERSIEISKTWTPKEARLVKSNYSVCLKSLKFVDKDKFLSFLLDKCTVVLIEVDDIFDSFCFFESGSERGKELEPTDLLKAYHLCSMRDKSENEKLLAITKWEEIGKDGLVSLLSLLFPIMKWSRNEECPLFSKSSISTFEGIEESSDYPFARRLKNSSFSIDSPIVNGKAFFSRCFYYYGLMENLDVLIDRVLPSIKKSVHRDIPSEDICYHLFKALALFVLDRFGEDAAAKCIPVLFKFSFSLIFEDLSVSWEKVNEYILERNTMFRTIQYSLDPYDIYSFDLKSNIDVRNVVYKGNGPVRAIDFDNDYDRWLRNE